MVYCEQWDEDEFCTTNEQLEDESDPVIEEEVGYQNSNEDGWFYGD